MFKQRACGCIVFHQGTVCVMVKRCDDGISITEDCRLYGDETPVSDKEVEKVWAELADMVSDSSKFQDLKSSLLRALNG